MVRTRLFTHLIIANEKVNSNIPFFFSNMSQAEGNYTVNNGSDEDEDDEEYNPGSFVYYIAHAYVRCFIVIVFVLAEVDVDAQHEQIKDDKEEQK